MRMLATFALTLLTAAPIAAQDIPPVVDTGQIAQGQVVSSMVRTHGQLAARRAGARGPTRAQISACENKGRFRSEYGAGHPKVQRLYSLCRGIGM